MPWGRLNLRSYDSGMAEQKKALQSSEQDTLLSSLLCYDTMLPWACVSPSASRRFASDGGRVLSSCAASEAVTFSAWSPGQGQGPPFSTFTSPTSPQSGLA